MGEVIADDDELLRRVHPDNGLIHNNNTGTYMVSKAALRDPTGGGEISVYASRLLPGPSGPQDLAFYHPGQALFAFQAWAARRVGFEIEHRPDQDEGPFADAHCNLLQSPAWDKKAFNEARRGLLEAMLWWRERSPLTRLRAAAHEPAHPPRG